MNNTYKVYIYFQDDPIAKSYTGITEIRQIPDAPHILKLSKRPYNETAYYINTNTIKYMETFEEETERVVNG